MKTEWSEFKKFVDGRSIPVHEFGMDGGYILKAVDGRLELSCKVIEETDEYDEYVSVYQSGANKTLSDSSGKPIYTSKPFADADHFRFRGKGIKGTADKDTTTSIDYAITENRYLNGVEIFLRNQEWLDDIRLQIVDLDGFGVAVGWYTQAEFDAMGNIYVADEFGDDWNIATDQERQGPYILPYPALIYTGLYIRIVYKSTGTENDVEFKANLFLHKKTA